VLRPVLKVLREDNRAYEHEKFFKIKGTTLHVTFDRGYSHPSLLIKLSRAGINYTCTCKKNPNLPIGSGPGTTESQLNISGQTGTWFREMNVSDAPQNSDKICFMARSTEKKVVLMATNLEECSAQNYEAIANSRGKRRKLSFISCLSYCQLTGNRKETTINKS
jgi:hypothetical protein